MENLSNRYIVKDIIVNLCETISKKTSKRFGIALIEAITRALEKKYFFLKNIKFNIDFKSEDIVNISTDLNTIDPLLVGRSIEAIIQVICMDLKDRAGSSLIDEFSENIDDNLINKFKSFGIDLDLLKIQQKYIYYQQKRKKDKLESKKILNSSKKQGLLDYSWDSVNDLKYDDSNRVVTIIGKDGKILDIINLDEIVINYLADLTTGETTIPTEEEIKKDNILKLKK